MTDQRECPDVSRLQALLEGTLTEDEQAELASHLVACETCRTQFDEMSERIGLLNEAAKRRLSKQGEPDDTLKNMVEQLRSEGPRRGNDAGGVTGDLTEAEHTRVDSISLDFLAPSDSAEYLGQLGNYQVTEVIGQGGMGIVLKAHDPGLNRFVAIKVMSPQLASNGAARKRFLREAQAAAAVSHDHVVTIHAVDETHDLPFLVMEYIDGVSLEERIKRSGSLELEKILRIGMQAASGLAAAHAQGLVHRDIKPANILLENGVERVKITDFGLARAADDVQITQTGVVAGTPQYMSPEQTRGETVDRRSDLFSLGCVLYAMCTGRSPFRASTIVDAIRRVCDDTPRPIQEVNSDIPDWLSAIVERLLEKDADDRLQSASEVSELLGDHLAHLQEPDRAAAPQPVRRLSGRKDFTSEKSRSLAVSWGAAAAIVVLAGVILAMMNRPRLPDVDSPSAAGEQGVSSADIEEAEPGETTEPIPDGHGAVSYKITRTDVRAVLSASGYVKELQGPVETELHLADGQYKLEVFKEGELRRAGIVDVVSGHRLHVDLIGHDSGAPWRADHNGRLDFDSGVQCIDISPAGGLLAVATTDGTARVFTKNGAEWDEVYAIDGPVRTLAFSPDGEVLATASWEKELTLWNAADGEWLKTLPARAETLAFSPDGTTMALGGRDETVELWDLASGECRWSIDAHHSSVRCIEFSPDGEAIASSCGGRDIKVWDAATGSLKCELKGYEEDPNALAFSADSRALVSCYNGWTARIWDVAESRYVGKFRSRGPEYALCFSPDGQELAVASFGCIWIFDAVSWKMLEAFDGHWSFIRSIKYTPDGKCLITGSSDGTVKTWRIRPEDLDNACELRVGLIGTDGKGGKVVLTGNERTETFVPGSPERVYLSAGKYDLEVTNLNTDEVVRRGAISLAPGELRRLDLWIPGNTLPVLPKRTPDASLLDDEHLKAFDTAFSPDGRMLLTGYGSDYPLSASGKMPAVKTGSGKAVIWKLEGTEWRAVHYLTEHNGGVASVAFAPDGKTVATAGLDGTVRIWDVETGKQLRVLEADATAKLGVEFSHQGRFLASSSIDGKVDLWECSTWSLFAEFVVGPDAVFSVAFSPDDTRLATAGESGSVVLWDVETQQELRRFHGHTGSVFSVGFSPDGTTLASSGIDTLVFLWNVETGEIANRIANDLPTNCAFSPNNYVLATSNGGHGAVRLFNWRSGRLLDEYHAQWWYIPSLSFSLDGRALATASYDGSANLWQVPERFPDDATPEVRLPQPMTSFCYFVLRQQAIRIAFSPQDPSLFATANGKWETNLWDHHDRRMRETFDHDSGFLFGMTFLCDGIMATATRDKEAALKLWDPDTCKETDSISLPASPEYLAAAPNTRQLAALQWIDEAKPATIVNVDAKTTRDLPTVCDGIDCGAHISAAWSPDGALLAVGTELGYVTLWDPATCEAKGKPLVHGEKRVWDVAFSPDGKTLASACGDSTVKLWGMTVRDAPKELVTLKGHTEHVCAVSFSPDGKLLVTAGGDYDEENLLARRHVGEIRLWDVETRQLLAAFPGHTERVVWAKFSQDGKTLATSGQDWKANLWDVSELLEYGAKVGRQ